jgi:hypothetical protein
MALSKKPSPPADPQEELALSHERFQHLTRLLQKALKYHLQCSQSCATTADCAVAASLPAAHMKGARERSGKEGTWPTELLVQTCVTVNNV